MKEVLICTLAICSGLLAIYAQAQSTPRFFYSADKQEVADSKTNLIWRRCVEGMNWNGTSCIGSEKTFTYREATKHTADLARLTGIDWRLPEAHEIKTIANKTGVTPETFETFFPATPPTWFWSSSPVVGKDGYFLTVGFCDDASGFIEVSAAGHFYLRLVRTHQDL